MQTTKKKPNILLIVLGAVLASYLGYLVAGAWREGIEFNAFLERFEMVCAYPLKDYFNEYTFRMIGYALAAYAIGVVMYYTSQRNYMPGKEFGTSKLANVKQINKVLADKDQTLFIVHLAYFIRHHNLSSKDIIVSGRAALPSSRFATGFLINRRLSEQL